MHSYLRAVGFSNIKSRKDLEVIIGRIMDKPDSKEMIKMNATTTLTEMKMDFAERLGVAIRGEYDEKGFFHLDHYFPYCIGQRISVQEEVSINKRVETEAYTGVCDDDRLGVSLIFSLQNSLEYTKRKELFKGRSQYLNVSLAGLSTQGMVILGVDSDARKQRIQAAETNLRNKLIAEAKMGNQDAIDSLTIDDIDMYAMIARRAKVEDVYSIVQSSFIPFGSESDNYTIIGRIVESKLVTNSMTGEQVYNLLIDCNDLIYDICINKNDLLGEPLPNRRFKGNIWMQGYAHFNGDFA